MMERCPRCGWQDALKTDEAAARLGVTKQTVLNWIESGKISGAIKEQVPGRGRYWIPLASVEALEESRGAA